MSTRRASKRVASQAPVQVESLTGAKKAKCGDDEIDGFKVKFEWEGDGDKWIQYSTEFNTTMVDAFNAGKQKVELAVANGAKMDVFFDKMVQKNKTTGWERRVCVTLKGPTDKDFSKVCWQDESSKWSSYGVSTCIEIAKAVNKKDDTIVTQTTPEEYHIDLINKTQTNKKTNFSRKFKREVTDSEAPCDAKKEDVADSKPVVKKENSAKGKSDKAKPKSAAKAEFKKEVDDEDKPKSGRGKAKKSSQTKSAPKVEVKDEEEEEDKPKSGRSKGSKSGKSSGPVVRTVILTKGSAPVDDKCPVAHKTSVYEAGNVVWDCMLNQTNISNNNNKYFLCQLLKENDKDIYYVWFRWGRVGYDGQNSLNSCGGNLDNAKKTFEKKFRDKTVNDWALRDKFVKHAGKYDLLKMDYSGDKAEDKTDSTVKQETGEDTKVPDSKLDKKLQSLIKLICDVKSMEQAVIEMKYDAKKAPLGKLTKDQIKGGYSALKAIEALINKKDTGRNLSDACSEFYTRIPHEFGMKMPPLIRSPQEVKEKLQLLEALSDIEFAIKMLKGGDRSENPVDRHYHQLKCGLLPLDHGHDDFKLVNQYLTHTHASTHNMYQMELLDVYSCDKAGEQTSFKDVGNRMLLWHGSRLTNWAGILGQGLRIAPPEAPVTGYMFGKGVYFADMSSKSANYCFATKKKNVGLMLLCDVALGSTEDKLAADYDAAKLPKAKHSVRGLGKVAPDPAHTVTMSDGVVVPAGKGKDTGVVNPSGYTLNYNEFIVYDTRQVRMRYLVQVKFNFR